MAILDSKQGNPPLITSSNNWFLLPKPLSSSNLVSSCKVNTDLILLDIGSSFWKNNISNASAGLTLFASFC